MRQRAGLAQALLGRPEIVFLDEPTSGLDPLGRRLVRDVIRELRAEGVAVFLNSHLLGEVEVTCDRVAFVKDGPRGARDGPRCGRPRPRSSRCGSTSVPPSLLDGLAAFGRDVRAEGACVSLRVDDESRLPEMSRWLVAKGVGIYSLGARRASLEEVFLEVVG